MPPDRDERDHWLAFAAQDLEVARLLLRHDKRGPACFHAQQCAEKAIKDALICAYAFVSALQLRIGIRVEQYLHRHRDTSIFSKSSTASMNIFASSSLQVPMR